MHLFAHLIVGGTRPREKFGIFGIFVAHKTKVADIRVSQQSSGMLP